jgi:tRNA A-37 threonylcarbamoyl transferase component Bud32
LYSVNWQRDIEITIIDGRKVIIKKDKATKVINEYLLVFLYSLISILLLHPSSPPKLGKSILLNEGKENRRILNEIGITTPRLHRISNDTIIEEYIEGGNLYKFLKNDGDLEIVFKAGVITGKLHNAGFCFIDNKAQNYLVNRSDLIRTDIGFIQKKNSIYSKSVDIGIFLSSLIDLDREKYKIIERVFLEGIKAESKNKIPYLSTIVRNISALGLSSNHHNLITNLFLKEE